MAELTPMMKQYLEIKKDNPDSILYILAPTVMICLLIISLVWAGKALEDVFNPSLRK